MTESIKYLQHRAALLKMVLEIARLYSAAYFSCDQAASRADDMMLLAAVLIGQADDRPMNASKLSAFAGMPRPTAIRKLQQFQDDGIVVRTNDTYTMNADYLNRPQVVAAYLEAQRQLRLCFRLMSKLDT